ncbi:hypothetical protein BU14_0392s0002 [Porphyra umbilicalis]|uniref:Serine/threonine protein phosphatase 2A regulatory subunit n=1 Tax=Porphyra umbilicalis TaxID=2786 RepID=A0A1X6NWF8_PORUM|nr:hypothetical protein BU14_0392s0002 [Porphyra umbilicalis]|eukprot:OSX72944.1 hypothetical protein BU14_0392s0002 [Porphyra umbilicalis]
MMTTSRDSGRDVTGSGGGSGTQPASAMGSRPSMQRAAGSYATGPAGSGADGADTPVLDPFLEMDRLPSLKSCATQEERQRLFIKKLRLCEAPVDWSNPRADLSRKESKRRTLVDVVELASSGYPFVFTPEVQRPLIASVSANLFRALPVGSATDDGLDAEDDEPRLEPAWPHVQVSYEVLRRFIVSNETDPKVACAVVDQPFVASLLSLFDSEDPREREYLKTILHRIYGKFMPLRVFIRRAITHTFHRFVYETQRQRTATAYRHHGAAELLEILGSIINGFTLPLKQEHKMFLRRTLLPLHVPKSLPSYHGQLSFCITQFVEKDPTLAVVVISGLLKLWPQTATRKAVLCLGELEEVLELTRPAQFAAVLPQLFRQISECIESPHFQIAERALFFWNNEYIVNLIVHHRERVVPYVFGALQRNAEDHWNPNVRSLSYNVQKLLAEMDNALYQRAAAHYVAEKDSSRAREHQRACSWVAAENLAASRKRLGGISSSAVSGGANDGRLLDSAVSSASSTSQPAPVASVVVANGVAVSPFVPGSSFSPTCSSETSHTMPVSAASTVAEQPPPTSSMPVPVPKGSSSISGLAVTSPPLSIALATATAGEAPITVSTSSTPASTGSTTSPVSVVDAPAASVLISPSSLEPLDVAPPTEGSRSTSVVNIDSSATSTRPSEDAAIASPLLTVPPPWTPPTLRAAESRSTVSDSSTIGLPSSPTSVSPSSSVADGTESTCTRAPTAVDLDANSSQRTMSPKIGRSTADDGKTQGNDASSSTGAKTGTSVPSSTPTVVGATRSRRSGGSGRSAKAAANAAAAAAAAAIAAAFPSVSGPPSKKNSASSAPKDVRPLTASSPSPSNERRPELASDPARAVP